MFRSCSLLRVIKCGTVLYIRLADKASSLRLYGFNMLESYGDFWRQITLDLIFLNMCRLLSLSAHSHVKDFTVVALSYTPLRTHIPMISFCVDSVIFSRLWSPSIRARALLTSTSKASPLIVIWKPVPPMPRLPASLPCFSGVCTQHHYSSLTSAQPVRDDVIAC